MGKRITILLLMFLSMAAFFSCKDWTSLKSLEISTERQYDKKGWDDYCASLRAYRQDDGRYLAYVRFANSPELQISEKSSLRSLPDSVDIVSLTNASNFSAADAEDMALMKEMGIKVLYRLDFGLMADNAELSANVDAAIASVKVNRLDGFSFTGQVPSGIIAKLSAAKGDGMLVFEGDPSGIAPEDLGTIDLFVLDTESLVFVQDVAVKVNAAKRQGIPADKILLAATIGASVKESSVEQNAVDAILERVVSEGPVRGMAFYNIEADYYHYEGNWSEIRSAIERLNPSR